MIVALLELFSYLFCVRSDMVCLLLLLVSLVRVRLCSVIVATPRHLHFLYYDLLRGSARLELGMISFMTTA